jgi:hypothetical protein
MANLPGEKLVAKRQLVAATMYRTTMRSGFCNMIQISSMDSGYRREDKVSRSGGIRICKK